MTNHLPSKRKSGEIFDSKRKFIIAETFACFKNNEFNEYIWEKIFHYEKNTKDRDSIILYYKEYLQSLKALDYNIKFISLATDFDNDMDIISRLDRLSESRFQNNNEFSRSYNHDILSENGFCNTIIATLEASKEYVEKLLIDVENNVHILKSKIPGFNEKFVLNKALQRKLFNSTDKLISEIKTGKINLDNLKNKICFNPTPVSFNKFI